MTSATTRIRLTGLLLALTLSLGAGGAASAQQAVFVGSTGGSASGDAYLFRGGLAGSSGVAGGLVAMPNGKYTEYTEDIAVKVAGGYVRWTRDFNGNQWRLNPHWMSLNFEFDTIRTTLSAGSGGGGGGGAAVYVPPPEPQEYFGGTVIPGTDGAAGGGTGPLWAVSRNGAWFTVDATFCSFAIQSNSRYTLKPVFDGEAPACPANRLSTQLSAGGGGGSGAGGSGVILPTPGGGIPSNLAGFRWEDRFGDWIEYDRSGRLTAYGDRNNIKVSMQYQGGRMVGVLDHTGRKVLEIRYDGDKVSEVRDVPAAGDPIPARVVKYTYASHGGLKTVTDVRGFVTTYEYDSKGRMSTVTDAEGRVRTLAYGPTNRVAKLTQPDGAVTEYDYDYDATKKQFFAKVKRPVVDGQQRVEVSIYSSDGQLISQEVNNRVQRELSQEGRTDRIIDGRGNVTETTRNEFSQVTSVRYADGASLSNTFSARHLALEQQRDLDGITHRFERDDQGNLRRRILAVGTADERVTEYTRDDRHRIERLVVKGRTESNGRITPDSVRTVSYDDQDNVVTATDPEGHVTRYTHNRLGQVLTETDPRQGTWRYAYDAAGHVVSATSPLGHVTLIDYDKVGNEVRVTDGRGKTYTSDFDGRNRLIRTVNPYGAVHATDYNAIGEVAAITDASGKTLRVEYDAWTRPTRARDGKGVDYTMDYADAQGLDSGARQPSIVRYPTFERRFKYNERNRPSQKTDLADGDGRTESYQYDGSGRPRTLTDANGKTRKLEYNAFGLVTRSVDPTGAAIQVSYDVRGNVIEIKDPDGRKTGFEYDRRDLLVRETDPLGQTIVYEYDNNGWPLKTTQPNGAHLEYQHDADGRLKTQKEFASDGALTKTTSFSYDEEDNLRGWSDGRFSAALTYDDAGRVTEEIVNFGTFVGRRAYTYHANNQVRSYTGPDGVTVSYAYDAAGQLERVTIPGEGDISVTDWQWSARKTVLLPGGTEQRLTHDGLLMTTGVKVVHPGQSTVFELEEKYGRAHEVTERRNDGVLTTYGYNDANRLTSVVASSAAFSEGYTVDASGNRVGHTRGGTPAGGAWTYDGANQLKQRGDFSYTYDANGNLVEKTDATQSGAKRTTRYAYDPQNRLTEVRDGAGQLVARYAYDPFDRRLSKQLGEGGAVTYYLPSPTGLLAEMTATGEVRVSYGWHPDHEHSTYPLFARMQDGQGGDRYVYYHNDHLGTPQRITDKAGDVVWAADYEGFGKATVRTAAADPVVSHLRYPGQYFDAETALHYNERRYYDPETGRYLTRDPIGFGGGINLYAYAAHDPVNRTDPTGEVIPLIVANYLRCVASCMVISTIADYFLECGNIKWGDNLKDCAIDCLLSMLPIPNPCGKMGKWVSAGVGAAAGAMEANSFTGDTMVHVRPAGAAAHDAQSAVALLKPISALQPGDEVLAWSEWKDRGASQGQDERLSYQRVTDVFTSLRDQVLVHLTLDNGDRLTATAGHAFQTPEGWRDAVLLRRGGQLLLKEPGEDGRQRLVTIADASVETRRVQVFNLEVAHAHTFFVGESGVLVHNGHGHHAWPKYLGGPKKQDLVDLDPDTHYKYHSGLDKVLPRCKGKAHYDKLRGKHRRQMYDDFRDYTDSFDKANGTDLLDAARRNGFPG